MKAVQHLGTLISLKCVLTRTGTSTPLSVRTYPYQHTQERFTYMYYVQVCLYVIESQNGIPDKNRSRIIVNYTYLINPFCDALLVPPHRDNDKFSQTLETRQKDRRDFMIEWRDVHDALWTKKNFFLYIFERKIINRYRGEVIGKINWFNKRLKILLRRWS